MQYSNNIIDDLHRKLMFNLQKCKVHWHSKMVYAHCQNSEYHIVLHIPTIKFFHLALKKYQIIDTKQVLSVF